MRLSDAPPGLLAASAPCGSGATSMILFRAGRAGHEILTHGNPCDVRRKNLCVLVALHPVDAVLAERLGADEHATRPSVTRGGSSVRW